MKLWAIKIPFDGQWLYVTEYVESMDFRTIVVKCFDTKEQAIISAKKWGDLAKVVEYDKPIS